VSGGSSPDDRRDSLSNRIRAFLENPYTNLVKGLALLTIGLAEASATFKEDVAHGRLRVGHGLIIIGLFSLLEPLPHLLDSLEAGTRYLDKRSAKFKPIPPAEPEKERESAGPERGERS
jgi:hypothetical protein